MRIKVSINLPWPLATLALALIGGLLAGIALLNYYSYKRINDFEKLTQVSLLNDQRKTQASEAQALLIKQQEEALAQAKIELSASALTSEQVSAKLDELKKNFASQTISSRETVITSADLAPYLTASVQIICVNDKGVGSTGSGTLWKFKEIPYGVITN
jgi:multidrug efflux pump subunit AcrA (membrane-fusion protein)